MWESENMRLFVGKTQQEFVINLKKNHGTYIYHWNITKIRDPYLSLMHKS